MARGKLGDICVELGLMSPAAVDRTVQMQKRGARGRFGEVAVALGFLDDEALARALAQQFRLNLVLSERVGRLNIPPEILGRLPAGLVRERLIVPVLYDEPRGVLTLLVADPTDLPALRTAQTAARVPRVRFFVAGRTALKKLVARILPNYVRSPIQDTVPGLGALPPAGFSVLFEPDPALASPLRKLLAREGANGEVVGDVEQVAAFLEANEGEAVIFREEAGPFVEAQIEAWRRLRPELIAASVPSWSRREPTAAAPIRQFFWGALEFALLANPGAEALLRQSRLAAELARAVGLGETWQEAVRAAALFSPEGGDGADAGALPLSLLDVVPCPWDIRGLHAALAARASGFALAGNRMPVEVLYTARAAARAGLAGGLDPVRALGAEAARHDGGVLEALGKVLEVEWTRRRLASPTPAASTILVASADPAVILQARTRLAAAGFEVAVVRELGTALAAIRNRPLGAVLVDATLPPRDGYALLGELRRDRALRRFPVLLLVQAGDPRAVTRAFELDVSDVVEQPVDGLDLLRRLRRVLPARPADARVLTGRLESVPLRVILDTLTAGAATARVTVAGEGETGVVEVEDGRVVRARGPGAAPGGGPAPVVAALQAIEAGGFEVDFAQGAPRPAAGPTPIWDEDSVPEVDTPTVVSTRPKG